MVMASVPSVASTRLTDRPAAAIAWHASTSLMTDSMVPSGSDGSTHASTKTGSDS